MTIIRNLTMSFIALFCLNGNILAQSEYDVRVGNALNGSMPFELRDAYEAGKDSLGPMLKCFAEAMLADWFNHPQEACTAIDNLVNNYQGEIGIGNVLGMLYVKATNMGRLGQYEEAAKMLDGVLQSVAPHVGDSALAHYYEKVDECRALQRLATSTLLSYRRGEQGFLSVLTPSGQRIRRRSALRLMRESTALARMSRSTQARE